MRDWNVWVHRLLFLPPLRFDLTYEGLKFFLSGPPKAGKSRFDLTYEGLKYSCEWIWPCTDQVLILPMRDWNTGTIPIHYRRQLSFDLTYEGLKYRFFHSGKGWFFVLILPMRDWNKIKIDSVFFFICWVLILPMRDWNPFFLNSSTLTFIVLILPMRDWNIHFFVD